MERYNSDVRDRGFNRTLNGSNLIPTHITVNVPDGNEENRFDLNERSNYTASVSEFVRGLYIARSFLVIGESATVGSAREPGHRDNPIVIEDDEDDKHGDAQHDGVFYEWEMSYEALLSLQEHIGGVGTGLKKNVIS